MPGAGIAGAATEARPRAAGRGIDQAQFQIARLAGGHERDLSQAACAFAVTFNRGAKAAHDEALSDRDAPARRQKRRGLHKQGRRKLHQRDVGGGAVLLVGLEIELRMARDRSHVLEDGLPVGAGLDEPVAHAIVDAVRGGEHKIAGDHRAAAEITAGADEHHFRLRRGRHLRRAANQGSRWERNNNCNNGPKNETHRSVIALRCKSPQVARNGPPSMSAQRSLSGDKRT